MMAVYCWGCGSRLVGNDSALRAFSGIQRIPWLKIFGHRSRTAENDYTECTQPFRWQHDDKYNAQRIVFIVMLSTKRLSAFSVIVFCGRGPMTEDHYAHAYDIRLVRRK